MLVLMLMLMLMLILLVLILLVLIFGLGIKLVTLGTSKHGMTDEIFMMIQLLVSLFIYGIVLFTSLYISDAFYDSYE